jgi:hypothetical protein
LETNIKATKEYHMDNKEEGTEEKDDEKNE